MSTLGNTCGRGARLLGAALMVVVVGAGLAGCGTTTGMATAASTGSSSGSSTGPHCGAGTTGTIEYSKGSLPPPYHYSWVLDFRADSGSMTLQGGWDDDADARWSKEFPLTAAQSTALCRLVIDAVAASDPNAEEVAPGSSSARVALTDGAGGTVDQDLVGVPELAGDAVDLLPEGVWSELERKFQAWSDEQQH